ncbi:hypothetical protein P3T35_001262 [Kitasatospora sp. GP30]|uniref:hypothetical protein n=1 Tax=Kitasatospora sp. GP30 TaxID=3035084 RepID=UPI00117CAD65|nr:hypothetical protein [Kitasatospora sp. GP30]MDH6139262.1 hypothetical protein [Kitasatospora sp. GP30]
MAIRARYRNDGGEPAAVQFPDTISRMGLARPSADSSAVPSAAAIAARPGLKLAGQRPGHE